MTKSSRKLPKGIIRDLDRHGNVRLYLRGSPKIRLHATPGTEAFAREVEAARRQQMQPRKVRVPAPIVHRKPAPPRDSLRWLVDEYRRRGEGSVSDGEFKRRVRELDRVCNHRRNGREIGEVAYKQMTAENMATIRDEMKRTTGARDNLLRIISALFYWAGGVGLMDPNKNPCHGVRSVHRKVGFHTWTEEEVEKFERRHPVGTTARLALGLGMFTVLRRKDLAILGPQHCWNGRITITPAKTTRTTGVEVNIPMLDCLAELIAATPTGETAFLLNESGRPFKTPACLGNAMQRWTEEAGIPQCSLHGLRKMGAVRAAMNGATVHQMMAIFGWAGLSQAEAYSRMAQRQLMAKAGIHTLAHRPARDEQDPAAAAAEG